MGHEHNHNDIQKGKNDEIVLAHMNERLTFGWKISEWMFLVKFVYQFFRMVNKDELTLGREASEGIVAVKSAGHG